MKYLLSERCSEPVWLKEGKQAINARCGNTTFLPLTSWLGQPHYVLFQMGTSVSIHGGKRVTWLQVSKSEAHDQQHPFPSLWRRLLSSNARKLHVACGFASISVPSAWAPSPCSTAIPSLDWKS